MSGICEGWGGAGESSSSLSTTTGKPRAPCNITASNDHAINWTLLAAHVFASMPPVHVTFVNEGCVFRTRYSKNGRGWSYSPCSRSLSEGASLVYRCSIRRPSAKSCTLFSRRARSWAIPVTGTYMPKRKCDFSATDHDVRFSHRVTHNTGQEAAK